MSNTCTCCSKEIIKNTPGQLFEMVLDENRNYYDESEIILMRKIRAIQLRKSAKVIYEKVGFEKKGISFKNFFKRMKRNYLRQGQ